MRKFWIIIVVCFFTSISQSQESAGLVFGKYNGLSSTYFNPAFSLRSPHNWELQLIGGQLFLENNYAFLNNSSFLDAIRRRNQIQLADSDIPIENYPLPLSFYQQSSFFLDGRAQVLGPGLLFHINPITKIGLTAKARSFATAKNIPSSLGYFEVQNAQIDSNLQLNAFDVNSATWMEYSAHLATQLNKEHAVGLNVKVLQGINTAFASNNFEYNYNREVGNIIQSLSDGSVEFGASSSPGFQLGGMGLGMDLGWTINNTIKDGSILGISLLDLGWMRYATPTYRASLSGAQSVDADNYRQIENIPALVTQMLDDGIQVDSTSHSTIFLPTALSVQFVSPVTDHLSVEAHVTHDITFAKRQLTRGSSLNLSLVYDRKHFSAFLPVTLYNERDLRIGAAVRFFYVTIGTDHIMSLLGQSQEFTGTDLYAKVNFYPFGNGDENNKPPIKCYF